VPYRNSQASGLSAHTVRTSIASLWPEFSPEQRSTSRHDDERKDRPNGRSISNSHAVRILPRIDYAAAVHALKPNWQSALRRALHGIDVHAIILQRFLLKLCQHLWYCHSTLHCESVRSLTSQLNANIRQQAEGAKNARTRSSNDLRIIES
jgi:hypothetical protein